MIWLPVNVQQYLTKYQTEIIEMNDENSFKRFTELTGVQGKFLG